MGVDSLSPATSLDDVHLTLSPEPLETKEEIEAFYRDDLNRVRGGDKTQRLKLGLRRAFQGKDFYKACLMGHQGVGKSTELTRLINDEVIQKKFCAIRLSVITDLDPHSFNPLDVFLLMIAEVVQHTAQPIAQGGAGRIPDRARL